MAHFYAGIHGNRGEATRLGTKSSGITAFVNGWSTGVRVTISYDKDTDQDVVYIRRTAGSGYGSCPDLSIRFDGKDGCALISGDFKDTMHGERDEAIELLRCALVDSEALPDGERNKATEKAIRKLLERMER